MKQKLFNSIIILICSTFLITIIATSCILYSDYKVGLEAADKRFEKLFEQTESAIVKHSYPNSNFIADFNLAIGSLEYYNYINLKNSNQNIYDYKDTASQLSSIFTRTKSRRLTEGQNIDLTLTVSTYTLSSQIIFTRTRIAFIIILSTTFLSILCLIYVYLNNTSNASNSTFAFEKDNKKNNFNDNISNNMQNDREYFTDDIDFSNDDEFLQDEQSQFEIPESEALNEPIESTELNTSLEKKSDDSQTEPNDLFSTNTGFCYEKYLITRLESELARASSSELDLSLILISIPSLKLENECGSKICKKVLDFFHYKDMIFEYQQDGIAIIHTNADINASMEISESMYVEIASILSEFEINTKPYFGIAARSLRFLSGDRLLTEAQQALVHAKEDDDSNIIAFRVNPEKYRQYIAKKSEN